MTIIEFYDSTAIHNALSTLLLRPDRLILFGTDAKEMYAFSRRLQMLMRPRNLTTKIQVIPIRQNSFSVILEKLENLVQTYPDCAFDLSGGQTEILVAMGALSQKYGVPMHMTDPVRNGITPLFLPERYPQTRSVRLLAEEYIRLSGGKITESYAPPSDGRFWKDVLSVWSVCRQSARNWNTALSCLHTFSTASGKYRMLDLRKIRNKLSPQKADTMLNTLRSLHRAGMLTEYKETEGKLSFCYKSEAVRHALHKEGSALELYTYYAAFVSNRRKAVFSDASVGVVMDWTDMHTPRTPDNVKNEIDVFLMRNITPVFISCKNGYVGTDELYKLSVVSHRFGCPFAKAAVVITDRNSDPSFLGRAKELSIRVIQNVHALSPAAFSDKIADFVTKI